MATGKQPEKPARKRDEPLSLYGMTPEQALAKALQAPPLKKKPASKKPPAK